MGKGLFHQSFHRHVVQDVTGVVDDAVLAVGRERVQRHVGDDPELRQRGLERPDGALGQALGVPGLPPVQRLCSRVGHREDGQRGDAQPLPGLRLLDQEVHGQPLDARHGGDRLPLSLALEDEDRVDQVIRGQDGFPHQAASEGVAPHPAHAGGGVAPLGRAGHEVSSANADGDFLAKRRALPPVVYVCL